MNNPLLVLFHNRQFQAIAGIQVFNVFSAQLLAPILPLYLTSQGLSASQIGMVVGITALGALIMRPSAGRAVDRRGSRPVILFGQSILAVCLSAYFLFTGFLPLLLIRFLHGAAQSFYSTACVTFASSVESPQNTAAAISLFTVFTMVGLGAATSMAPLLYHSFDFFPLVGISLLALGIAISFTLWRARPIAPLHDAERLPFSSVLHLPAVWAPTVCLFASSIIFSTLFTFVPLYALSESVPGYSSFYIAFAIAVIFTRLGVQSLTQAFQAEKVATAASLMNVASALILLVSPSTWTFALSGILIGLGFGVIFPALTVYVVQRIPPTSKGTGLSILTAAGDVGNALGAAVLGVVAEKFGFRWVFISAALVVVFCVRYFYVTLVIKPPRQVGL
jgi:predicted MFS family arabinose efflux permease